VIVLVSQW